MTASDPGAAFRDLAQAVTERVCVPFLGAGISFDVKWPKRCRTHAHKSMIVVSATRNHILMFMDNRF
jgi:hypothetical protein